jgi:hypothetical protein
MPKSKNISYAGIVRFLPAVLHEYGASNGCAIKNITRHIRKQNASQELHEQVKF